MATKLTTYSLPAALKELPKRILIAKWGDNPNVNAPLKMGAKTMTYAATLAKARGHERIALDYQHNTVPGSPAHKESTEPRKVAAYGTLDLVEGDGAYLVIDAYTPSGLENAAEFSDVSPAVERDENGEILFFHSVGLCRNGAVDGLEFQTFEVEFEVKAEEPEAKPAPKPKAAKPAAAPTIPDNIELLKGVGPKLVVQLKSLGITSLQQIASWSAADIAEIDSKLGVFAGRPNRDNWVDQAKLLVAGDVAGFEKKYGALGSEITKG